MAKKMVIAYVPVIHKGYVNFFFRHGGTGEKTQQIECFVLGDDVIRLVDKELDYLRKEIRAISSEQASLALTAIDVAYEIEVRVLGLEDCERIARDRSEIVLPNDDVSRVLVGQFFGDNPVSYDDVFLRWDRRSTTINKEIEPDQTVTSDGVIGIMSKAAEKAGDSTDWWRRVGAAVVIADTSEVAFASCNHHLPTAFTPYLDGDPRNTAHRGEGLELYTSIHAEADIVAWAARTGTSLLGASVFVTTFPCPSCASLLSSVGIARLYYAEGYAMLNGVDLLRQSGVELIKVLLP